jgi:hypothetical protein
MASIAKGEGKGGGPGSFDCMQGDIRTAKAPGAPYDAVLSLFHVISYLTSNDDLLATFHNAASQLRDGGIFFFDVWHGPAVLTQKPAVRLKSVDDAETRLRRIAEPTVDEQKSIVTVHYTMFAESKGDGAITTFDEKHFMRYLFPTEVDLLARQTGFVVERTEEFGSGAAASAGTWGVAYVLRRTPLVSP